MAEVHKNKDHVITVEMSPEEVLDAVRSFAWYQMWTRIRSMIGNKKYVFGSATWDGEKFVCVYSPEIKVPRREE